MYADACRQRMPTDACGCVTDVHEGCRLYAHGCNVTTWMHMMLTDECRAHMSYTRIGYETKSVTPAGIIASQKLVRRSSVMS